MGIAGSFRSFRSAGGGMVVAVHRHVKRWFYAQQTGRAGEKQDDSAFFSKKCTLKIPVLELSRAWSGCKPHLETRFPDEVWGLVAVGDLAFDPGFNLRENPSDRT